MRDVMGGQEAAIERRPRLTVRPASGDALFYQLLLKGAAAVLGLWAIGHVLLSPGETGGIGTKPFALSGLPRLLGNGGFPVEGLSDASLRGQVTVVNVFATWCGPCRDEHPALLALAARGRIRLVGLLSGDKPENGTAYLREHGNPFAAVAADSIGLARRLGATAYPTTIILDRNGKVVTSLRGGLDAERIESVLLPAFEKALRS